MNVNFSIFRYEKWEDKVSLEEITFLVFIERERVYYFPVEKGNIRGSKHEDPEERIPF